MFITLNCVQTKLYLTYGEKHVLTQVINDTNSPKSAVF